MKTYYYVITTDTTATIVPAHNKERLRCLGFSSKNAERFDTVEEAREYCEDVLFFEKNEVKFWS